MAKNFVVLNVGQFFSFPSIVIPSLIGVSTALNPDEMIKATAAQTSWLCELFSKFVYLKKKTFLTDLSSVLFANLQLALLIYFTQSEVY